jgi:hypothetical protein
MRRMLGALLVGVSVAAVCQAHALYVLADGGKVMVIFSDDFAPDSKIKEATWKKVEGLKLTARIAGGKTAQVTPKLDGSSMTAAAPPHTELLFGSLDYGISTHGEKPKFVKFYIKAIVGPIPADGGKLDAKTALDVVPVMDGGKVRFAVYQFGKPVAKANVEVMFAEKDDKSKVTTDEKGLTPAFAEKGRYGVTVRVTDGKEGEFQGAKFSETSHTATLVVDVK